jgi:hypothetical protein
VEIKENGLLYEIQTENGVEVCRYIKCAFLQLDIRCEDVVAVNQELDVTIVYLDYEDNPQDNSADRDMLTTESLGILIRYPLPASLYIENRCLFWAKATPDAKQ